MDLLVVGAGEMGRWFGRASGANAVAFADRDPAVAREAADDVDGARSVDLDGEERFEVVCVAVPMPATPGAVAKHADRATEAVCDVSGEMDDAVAALQEHAAERERASFHPLFSAANAPGNVPVVVGRDGPCLEGIRERLSAAGNRVFETTPTEHDRAMETVQAKAHAAVLALVEPQLEGVLPERLPDDGRVGPALDVLVNLLGVDRTDVPQVAGVLEDGVDVGHPSFS